MHQITPIINYLKDIYCVFYAGFKVDYSRKNTLKNINFSNHFADIYCVGSSIFPSRNTKKSTKSNVRRFGFKLGKKNVKSNNETFLTKFYKLQTFNQSIIVGCFLIISVACAFPVWLIYSQGHITQVSAQQPKIKPYFAPNNSISGKPVRIYIPSLQINLPVINGEYDPRTNNWTLTDTSAQYLVDSAEPNNKGGKTFIYGHALKNIFGKLPDIEPGESLFLTTDNDYRFKYIFKSSFSTSPSDLSVLKNTEKPVLYVQTCSGTFYQNRQIFQFEYVSYEKS